MVNFYFLEKGLGIVSSPNFVYKILLPDCSPGCDSIHTEINLTFFNPAAFRPNQKVKAKIYLP